MRPKAQVVIMWVYRHSRAQLIVTPGSAGQPQLMPGRQHSCPVQNSSIKCSYRPRVRPPPQYHRPDACTSHRLSLPQLFLLHAYSRAPPSHTIPPDSLRPPAGQTSSLPPHACLSAHTLASPSPAHTAQRHPEGPCSRTHTSCWVRSWKLNWPEAHRLSRIISEHGWEPWKVGSVKAHTGPVLLTTVLFDT